MRSRGLGVLVLVGALALASSACVSTGQYDEALDENERLVRELADARDALSRAEQERDGFRDRFLDIENAYQRLDSRTQVLEEMVGTLRSLGHCIRRLQIEVDELESGAAGATE